MDKRSRYGFSCWSSRTLFNVGVMSFLMLSSYYLLDELMKRNYNASEIQNRECSPGTEEFCGLPQEMQFTKFIWVLTDGWPRIFADEMLQHYKDNSVLYSVHVPGLKLSHSIYISYFTGEPPMYHWLNRVIVTDSLVDSVLDAGFKLGFSGYQHVVWEVLGEERHKRFGTQNLISSETDDEKVHQSFFEKFEEEMERTAGSDESLIVYSSKYDTKMHEHGHNDKQVTALSDDLTTQLKRFKSWIQAHPDYLLILCSDHGVDGPGKLLHGHTMEGNDGYLMFYSPYLSPSPERKIDVVDVAATISKYLKGVSIPGTSVGMPQNFYGPFHSIAYSKALYQSLRQINRLAKSKGLELPSSVEKTLQDPDAWKPENSERLLDIVKAAKSILYTTSSLSVTTFLLNISVGAVVLYLLFSKLNPTLFSQSRDLSGYVASLQHFGYLLAMYIFPFFSAWSLLFWHIDHDLDFNTNRMATICGPVLALLLGKWAQKCTEGLSYTASTTLPNVIHTTLAIEGLNSLLKGISSVVSQRIQTKLAELFFPTWVLYGIAFWSLWAVFQPFDKPAKYTMFRFYSMILVVMWMFEQTSEYKALYFLLEFHVLAFIVYISLGGSVIIALLRHDTKFSHILYPGLMLLFFVTRIPVDRFFVWLCGFQLVVCVQPLLESVKDIVELPSKVQKNQKYELLLLQTVVLLVLNQSFFHFSVITHNTFDINLDPVTGAVGRLNWDVFVPLSVLLMTYAKYSPFMFYTMALYYSFQDSKFYYLPVSLYILNFCVENAVIHEVQWRYMMPDSFIWLLCSCLAVATVAIIYVSMDILRMQRWKPSIFARRRQLKLQIN